MILRDSKATDVELKDATHLYAIAIGAAATVTRSVAVGLQMLPLIVAYAVTASVTLSITGVINAVTTTFTFAVSPSGPGALGSFTPPGANPPWYQEWQGPLFDQNTVVSVSVSSPGAGNTVALRVLSTIR